MDTRAVNNVACSREIGSNADQRSAEKITKETSSVHGVTVI